jgi:peptide/nickel transport system permease protein
MTARPPEITDGAPARAPTGAERFGPLRRLRRNRPALVAAVVLICMYCAAGLAGFLAPYGVNETHYRPPLDLRHHPPMAPRIVDAAGRVHWPPFVYGSSRAGEEGPYRIDEHRMYPLRIFAKGETYGLVFGLLKWDRHLFGVEEPGRLFLFGTDQLGRDVFSRVLYGARISLSVGLLGIAISIALGLLLGAVAGFYGGVLDSTLMRLSEVLMSLPGLYLIVALGGLLPAEMPSDVRYVVIVAILSLLGWAGVSRVVRGMVLSIRENEYVLAARALGAGSGRVILRHVIPNTMSYVVVAATVSVPYYILGEASLSFLGVGIKEPQASWGLMLSEAQSVTAMRDYTWLLIPGVLIFLVVMCFNLLGDGLRDSLDPKSETTRAGLTGDRPAFDLRRRSLGPGIQPAPPLSETRR